MHSIFAKKSAFKPSRIRRCPISARQTAFIALLTAMCSIVTIPTALAQTDSSARAAFQGAKQKAKLESRKPLDSDASYVCTLSGFGNLAHCYPR
jgi:hypothetical protein